MRIKRKKNINVITILFSITALLLVAATILYYTYNQEIVGKTNLNNSIVSISKETYLRTGPAETYPIIKTLSSASELSKQTESNEWLEVRTKDNIVGWIPGWNVTGSDIKSPEEKMQEQLSKYTVVLNPINNDGHYDYNWDIAKFAKEELEKLKISVHITRSNNENIDSSVVNKIILENKADIIVNINVFNDEQFSALPALYYSNTSSQILGKYLEKSLSNNYILKTSSAAKNEYLVKPVSENIPEVLAIAGNIHSDINRNILDDETNRRYYAVAMRKGIEEYFYYLIKVDNYYEKRKEQLVNMPQKGMNIPFYYTKQDEFKDIAYGSDNNRKISDNGDIIIDLMMINDYLEPSSTLTVSNIVDWAKDKYYIAGQGSSEKIIIDFAEKQNFKVESVQNKLDKIEEALKNNKPIIVKFGTGQFGNKITYKVIRGIEDNKYYINDPDDDDLKLNNYTGFTKAEMEKNLLQAWIFSK